MQPGMSVTVLRLVLSPYKWGKHYQRILSKSNNGQVIIPVLGGFNFLLYCNSYGVINLNCTKV